MELQYSCIECLSSCALASNESAWNYEIMEQISTKLPKACVCRSLNIGSNFIPMYP